MINRIKWSGNNVEEKGAMMISELLKTNTTLTYLSLECEVIERMRWREMIKKDNINWQQYWR